MGGKLTFVAALAAIVRRPEATPEPLRGPFYVPGLKPYAGRAALRNHEASE